MICGWGATQWVPRDDGKRRVSSSEVAWKSGRNLDSVVLSPVTKFSLHFCLSFSLLFLPHPYHIHTTSALPSLSSRLHSHFYLCYVLVPSPLWSSNLIQTWSNNLISAPLFKFMVSTPKTCILPSYPPTPPHTQW